MTGREMYDSVTSACFRPPYHFERPPDYDATLCRGALSRSPNVLHVSGAPIFLSAGAMDVGCASADGVGGYTDGRTSVSEVESVSEPQ